MIDYESATISARFFDALNRLKADGKISGITEFCDKYGYNRRNMGKQKLDPMRSIFRVSWIHYLARDYGVSGDWLLTGYGDFYRRNDQMRAKKVQEIQALLESLR